MCSKTAVLCSRTFKLLENVVPAKNELLPYRSLSQKSGLNLWNEELTPAIKHQIEAHWNELHHTNSFDEHDESRLKYYVLSMFPYPSGQLHMGHVRVYTISDTVARFQRMNGKNVFHPIGWDAFGLPAENAAIERQVAPETWTRQNIAHMKEQLQRLGCSFDWSREIATCDTDYYRWTQELFLKLLENGLVYQKDAMVNWDPVDNTVLADEQVDENGCSWRSGAKVDRKLLKQWFIKTTFFAKDLMEGLDDPSLIDWRDIIKVQKHWIGKCDGVSFDFEIRGAEVEDFLKLWTSRPEFIKQAEFVAVSPAHYLANREGRQLDGETKRLLIGAENPFTKKQLPIFVTTKIEFLPMTDTHLGITAASEQDYEFAKTYNVEVADCNNEKFHVEAELQDLRWKICKSAKRRQIGGYETSAKLKDWLISRQRYWGTPIPIIHCENCGAQPVPRRDLPVCLPKLNEIGRKSGALLKESPDWLNTVCPKCGGAAKRETDTMDTFVDSSWYYLRYLDPQNTNEMFDKNIASKMMPVDLYIGGKEHATLHLYYARFINHFLQSLNLVPCREPFKKLLVQGMVMGRSYRVKGSGRYLPENQVKVMDFKRNKAVHKETGEPVVIAWEKMSKSKYNGVDPTEMFNEYGVDTTRLLILGNVAPTSHRNWNSNTFPGIINWQKRLWLTVKEFLYYRNNLPEMIDDDKFKAHEYFMFDSRNYYVKGVTFNYQGSQQLSVAISKMQGLTNSLRKCPPVIFARSLQFERALAAQIIVLAPMAPHFASELWCGFVSAPNRLNLHGEEISWDKNVLGQKWPVIDQHYSLDLVCVVSGNETAVVKVPRVELERMSKEEALRLALKQKAVQLSLANKNVVGVSFVLHKEYEATVYLNTQSVEQHKECLIRQEEC